MVSNYSIKSSFTDFWWNSVCMQSVGNEKIFHIYNQVGKNPVMHIYFKSLIFVCVCVLFLFFFQKKILNLFFNYYYYYYYFVGTWNMQLTKVLFFLSFFSNFNISVKILKITFSLLTAKYTIITYVSKYFHNIHILLCLCLCL